MPASNGAGLAPSNGLMRTRVQLLVRRPRLLLSIVFQPVHLRRTATIAVAVGTWLTLVNHGDELVQARWSWDLAPKIILNYLTPFTVSNLGLLSRTFHNPADDGPRRSARGDSQDAR